MHDCRPGVVVSKLQSFMSLEVSIGGVALRRAIANRRAVLYYTFSQQRAVNMHPLAA